MSGMINFRIRVHLVEHQLSFSKPHIPTYLHGWCYLCFPCTDWGADQSFAGPRKCCIGGCYCPTENCFFTPGSARCFSFGKNNRWEVRGQVKDEGRGTYLQCIRPQDMPASADTDLLPGAGYSIVLRFANITHRLNKWAAGIVWAWIVTLGNIAEMLACHSLWYSVQVRSFEIRVQTVCAGGQRRGKHWTHDPLNKKKKNVWLSVMIFILYPTTPPWGLYC